MATLPARPRKSFSGRGRKRLKGLVPLVEANGRLRRPPPSERESVAEVVSIVLAQPHRRDVEDARAKWHLATAIGRMIEAHPEWWGRGGPPKASLIEAAKRYGDDWTRFQAAVTGTRRPLAVTAGWTPLDDPERELKERRDAERRWADLGRALRDAGRSLRERGVSDPVMVERACHFVICDDHPETWSPPYWIEYSMPIALLTLIRFYGLEE